MTSGHAEIDLRYMARPWQRQVHLNLKRFSILALHRRAGKTLLAVMELIHRALACSRDGEPGRFIYLAPFLAQAKSIAWGFLCDKVRPLVTAGVAEIREGELSVRFLHNGSMIRLFGGDNPNALRGLGLDFVVVDEVAQLKPEVWVDVLRWCLADRKGGALFIGTPHGVNLFSELWTKAENQPDWYRARWTVYDTKALPPDELAKLEDRNQTSERSFAREALCDFAAAGDDQLISLAEVEAAAHRVYHERDYIQAPRIVGIDPARFGDDRSVIIKRQGLQCFQPDVFRGIDNMDLAARAANVIQQWNPDAVFIDAGNGAGVIDRLRQLGFSVVEVPFGGRAIAQTQFKDRRMEMWAGMSKWIKAGGAIPDVAGLKLELATPTYWFDAQGRQVLEPKDEIKKRLQGGGSPDIADALALTFAAPVTALSAVEKERQRWDDIRQARHDVDNDGDYYDPYAKHNLGGGSMADYDAIREAAAERRAGRGYPFRRQ